MLLCLVKGSFGWRGWSISGLERGLLFTGLLGADKTGRGRSGQEGRLLLGHAASSRDGVRGRPTDRSKASTSAAAD
jgi:hypothetical protein